MHIFEESVNEELKMQTWGTILGKFRPEENSYFLTILHENANNFREFVEKKIGWSQNVGSLQSFQANLFVAAKFKKYNNFQ